MSTNDLSSEKIAKALKGAGLSVEQRIVTATEAWSNNQLFFPNKDDFLFEWLCTALVKTKVKSPADCAAFQIAYWRLLHHLLAHYTDRANETQKQPPAIRVQLITAITALLGHLSTLLKSDDNENTTTTTTTTPAAAEIVDEFFASVKLLLSPTFALSYRPTFEQMSTAVDQLMDTLSIALEKRSHQKTTLNGLAQVATVLLKRYSTQLVQTANQRKSFTTIVEKTFAKFLCVRRRIVSDTDDAELDPSSAQAIISEEITDILVKGLFHPDVVFEYISVLKDNHHTTTTTSTTNSKTAYVSKLFEELSRLLENKDQKCVLDALDVFPVLFSNFVQAFRKKRGKASQDMDRQVEFGFFAECRALLDKVERSSAYIQTLSQLLQELVQLNVYVARNDELSQQQYAALEEIAQVMVTLLQDRSKTAYQRSILQLAVIVLKVDFSLIEGRITLIWPYMLNPEKEAENECLDLAIAVLQTYAASRQIDAYADDLINALQDLAFEDVYTVLEKPLFSRQFMDELSATVNKHMPAAQALGIFERLAQGIQESTTATFTAERPVSKKQKHGHHHAIPRHRPTARFIAIFLSQFINAVKLTQHQRQAFEQPARALYENFIRPSLDKQQGGDVAESNIIPALQVHTSLMNTMSDIYWAKLDQAMGVEWLGNTLESVFLAYATSSDHSQSDRVAMVQSANALLQHAYYAYVIGSTNGADPLAPAASSPLVSRVNSVLDYVLSETGTADFNATWNGSLLQLTDSGVKIALWKLLADEWFDVICQFAAGERGKKLTSFVLLSLIETPSTTTMADNLTLRSTSELLLRSANFYEAQCFKEHSLSVILDSFASFFASNADPKLAKCYANFKDFGSSADELASVVASTTPGKHATTAKTTHVITKALRYLDQLLLFPMEYYTKQERQNVVWLVFMVDALAGTMAAVEPETRSKAQLFSRTLLLRFFAASSNGNILEMNADLLGWFLATTTQDHFSDAVMERTKQLDILVLRSLFSMIISKRLKAMELFDRICKMRIEWLKKGHPNAQGWIIDIVETINDSLQRHASKDDIVTKISAQEFMTELSQYVVQALNEAKARISTTVDHESEQISVAPIDTSMLVLVSLLQEYAQLLGQRGDEVVGISALSRVMVGLASPCTTLLQRSLRSSSSLDRSAITKMTTAFVGSLCKMLSRHQHVYVTERVFAVIWFIYSLVYDTDEQCAQSLCRAFSLWVAKLDSEQFTVVTRGFIEQSNRLITQATEKDRKVYLSLLSEMLSGSTDEQKSWLRRYLPALVTKLSTISRQAETIEFIQQALNFLTTLSAEQSLRTSAYDVSLILACLLQVTNPPHTERFEHVSKETAHEVYHSTCDVLQNLLLYHRQQLVDIMAPFIATLQALLYCFRSPHLALVTKKRKHEETTQKKFALISTWAPLEVSAAYRLARIFSTMAKKSTGGNSSSSSSSKQRSYTGLQQYRIISRHAPFILIEYFTIQSNVTISISQPQVKAMLETGLYNLMDMTSENDRNMVLAGLDASAKLLFKNFYTSWKETHMYTGQ